LRGRWRIGGLALLLACGWPSASFAQAAAAAPAVKTIDELYVDFAVPDLPALAALDLNPTRISRPGNLKELSVAVFPLAGETAMIGPGVAIAWAPVYTFANSVDDYRRPLLRRLAFSLVTTQAGKTDAINLGAGVRVMLVDRSDPVMSATYQADVFAALESGDVSTRRSRVFLQTEVEPTIAKVADLMSRDPLVNARIVASLLTVWDLRRPPAPFVSEIKRREFDRAIAAAAAANSVPAPAISGALNEEIDELVASFMSQTFTAASSLKARLARIDETFRESHWNAAVASVDAGIVSQSPDGTWAGLERRAFGASVAAAFPLGARAQVIAQLQGRTGLGSDDTSSIGGGARLIAGTSTKRFSAEAFVASDDDGDAASDGKSYRFTFGSEFRLARGFWLEVAFGSEHTPASSGQHLLSLANLKYAFRNEPRFKNIPGSAEQD